LATTLPVVNRYTDAAEKIQKLTLTNPVAAQAALPEFQKVFKELEKQMSSQAGVITTMSNSSDALNHQYISQSKNQILSILVTASLILVFASLWLARSLAEPMSHAVNIADQLAQGNLAVPVVISGNAETAQLLTAMAHMQSSFAGIVKNVKINAQSVAIASAEIAQGTQQNASLVEEMAAAASSLKSRSQALVQEVAVFKLEGDGLRAKPSMGGLGKPFSTNEPAPFHAAKNTRTKGLTLKQIAAKSQSSGHDKWQTF